MIGDAPPATTQLKPRRPTVGRRDAGPRAWGAPDLRADQLGGSRRRISTVPAVIWRSTSGACPRRDSTARAAWSRTGWESTFGRQRRTYVWSTSAGRRPASRWAAAPRRWTRRQARPPP